MNRKPWRIILICLLFIILVLLFAYLLFPKYNIGYINNIKELEDKYKGLHGNLWVNRCEIHQNPSSVKRQSGITAPYGRFYSVCHLTAART